VEPGEIGEKWTQLLLTKKTSLFYLGEIKDVIKDFLQLTSGENG
jgi:hypothetical protein